MTGSCNPYTLQTCRDTLEYALGVPFSDGNLIQILRNGDEIFPEMLRAIASARTTIDFVTFVYWKGDIAVQFAEALAERARAGVVVRVLLDSFGAKAMDDRLIDEMDQAGAEVRWFRPLSTFRIWRSDKRTHRKLLICDNKCGFTGGVGIAEEWNGDARNPQEWRDTHVRVEGQALLGLRAAFLDNWNESGEWLYEKAPELKVQNVGDTPVQVVRASTTIGWTDIACLIRTLVAMSRKQLWITTAYFVPDMLLTRLLCDAVRRGVDVRILIPGKQTDSRLSQLAGQISYDALLDCGVRLFHYQQTLLHTKVLTVDGLVSCIGSANLNHRSLGKDEECCIVALSETVCATLDQHFAEDCKHADEIKSGEWPNRGALEKMKERGARLLVEQL